MSDSRVSEIYGRLESATQGEWKVIEDENMWELYAYPLPSSHGYKIIKAPKTNQLFMEYWPNEADSNFIENAKSDIEYLLSEIHKTCIWKNNGTKWQDADGWDTSCGWGFNSSYDTPRGEELNYCPYCGGKIQHENTR